MSASVGTGRRYRLPDELGGGEITATERQNGYAGVPEYLLPGGFTLFAPKGHPLTPVGLDMAEPGPGVAVLVGWTDGEFVAYQPRDLPAGMVHWDATTGRSYTWDELCALPDVSITVLVPRDDDLRERVAAARATAAEKATNLTERTPIGAVHAYYRDVFADLLAESGWSINGRRPQADDGE